MKILYIMSSYNIYGGTPKKTLDLIKKSDNNCFLYMYEKGYGEFKHLFVDAGALIYEGFYKRNIFLHLKALLRIIDKNNVQIVQTQFTMGEILGGIIKKLRPHIKLIVAFVGSSSPSGIKKYIVSKIYESTDAFVYISNYVKEEKIKHFPILANNKFGKVIYNGTNRRESNTKSTFNIFHPALVDIAGLTRIKNISILIEAISIIRQHTQKEVFLYVAGDGPERQALEEEINRKNLCKYVHLLGYQKNVGELIDECDIFVHPCYMEGFGIAVAEAMIASRPLIVSDAGALPELVDNGISGLVVDPFDAYAWAEAILKLLESKDMADEFGENARNKAQNEFSIEKYVSNYHELYMELLDRK